MMIAKMIDKYGKIIKYLFCSIVSAVVEITFGWLLLQFLSDNILVTNTIAIFIGAVAHYFLTMIFVFHQKNGWKSVFVYVVTFVFGLLLQNGVIWLFYDMFLVDTPHLVRYVLSKGFSLVIPFAVVYYVRNLLNRKFLDAE